MDECEQTFDDRILLPGEDEVVVPVYTQPLHEFRLKEFCDARGVINYLPLKRTFKFHNVSSKGKSYSYRKVVLRPLFASYVFVRIPKKEQSLLFSSKSVIRILSVGDQQSFLASVRTVRAVELAGFQGELEFNVDIKEGERFLIESGIWQGVCGWLVKKEKKYLWTVEIEFLNELIRATIDPSQYKMSPAT
ncbi:MAG: UpxY family transcription antiterminator [Victivallales bacterium]|nr:UpxY family transcription antiterminator [Victivallales bacterium]